MKTTPEEISLEHPLIQQFVTEAVKAGMMSPLRDPILEAAGESIDEAIEGTDEVVDETDKERGETIHEEQGEDGEPDQGEKRRLTNALQGGAVFVVMFVVLYVTLRRLTSDEDQ